MQAILPPPTSCPLVVTLAFLRTVASPVIVSISCLRRAPAKPPVRFTADIEIGPVPVSAFKNIPSTSNSFIYSTCRSLNIKVANANQSDLAAEASLVVADPTWLDALKCANKGKVITGATCGAESAPEDATVPGPADYINSLMTAGPSKTHSTRRSKTRQGQSNSLK